MTDADVLYDNHKQFNEDENAAGNSVRLSGYVQQRETDKSCQLFTRTSQAKFIF